MANRAYLASSSTGELTKDNYAQGRLACNYFIGVLWPILFSKDSLRYFKLQNTNGQEFDVPYLSISKESALKSFDEKSTNIYGKLDDVSKSALLQLKDRVAQFDAWVILDATEIWMLGPDDFDVFLLDSIQQIDSGDLSALIEQVGLSSDDKLEVYHYMGMDWNT